VLAAGLSISFADRGDVTCSEERAELSPSSGSPNSLETPEDVIESMGKMIEQMKYLTEEISKPNPLISDDIREDFDKLSEAFSRVSRLVLDNPEAVLPD